MPAWPAHWAGDVVLSDGGAAHVRPIRPEDGPRLAALHARLSPESIYLRFFSPHPRLSAQEIVHFTGVDHDARVALVVLLGEELIGVGRYDRIARTDVAEVAFVVDDAQQGRGIATLLLERLAAAGRERRLHRFTADVLPHNRAMLHVFHDAGFEATSRFEGGVVRVSFPIGRTARAVRVAADRERAADARSIARLLAPTGIGLITEGAAADEVVQTLQRRLAAGGFAGPVRRLSAHAPSGDTAGLDLVFIAVPPDLLAAQIERCAEWGVHGAVLLGGHGADDEAPRGRGDDALAARARRGGLRLLGPSSLGIARLAGSRLVGIAAETTLGAGSLALFTESPERGRATLEALAVRGMGLSTFVSAGRKADVSASDALQFWEGDDATRVIALALRSLGNPRRSAAIARRVARHKPVLVWPSDLPSSPPDEFVRALALHTGVIGCTSLEDLLDVAQALLAPEAAPRSAGVAARIAAWESWRGEASGRAERAPGVERFAARKHVDILLAAHPEGLPCADADAVTLLQRYGVDPDADGDCGADGARLRVVQNPSWGSLVAVDAGLAFASARLLPLTRRDLHALADAASPALRPKWIDLLRRVATLAVDVPELAALTLRLPERPGEPPSLVRGSARLAPWTLGLALSETADG